MNRAYVALLFVAVGVGPGACGFAVQSANTPAVSVTPKVEVREILVMPMRPAPPPPTSVKPAKAKPENTESQAPSLPANAPSEIRNEPPPVLAPVATVVGETNTSAVSITPAPAAPTITPDQTLGATEAAATTPDLHAGRGQGKVNPGRYPAGRIDHDTNQTIGVDDARGHQDGGHDDVNHVDSPQHADVSP